MTKLARLTVTCLVAALPLTWIRAADTTPPVVIESAPEADVSKLQQEIAALRAENQRLTGELRDAQWALAEAKTRIDELNAPKPAPEPNAADAAAEKARADEANARLATLVAGVEKLNQEKTALENRLTTASKTEAELRQQLAAAQQAAHPPPPAVPPETVARLSETENKLSEANRQIALLKAENQLLNQTSADHARLTGEVQSLRQDKAALEAKIASAAAATPVKPENDAAELASKLAQSEAKLATVLRSYSQLQAETDRLKSAASTQNDQSSELATLRQEKAALEARIAAIPPDQSHVLASKLADVEDRLSTTLHSYTLLQRENDRLKADADKAVEAAQASAAKSSSEAATQASTLFDELRQTQAQATALAAENAQLKTRLALVGAPPGSTMSSPTRPGTAQASSLAAPAPVTEPAAPAVAAAPQARTHVVVLGDTLGRISRQYYGTPSRWDEILRANRDVIKNENVLTVGMTLRIP